MGNPRDQKLTRRQSENIRWHIASGAKQLAERLKAHAAGEIELSSTQVKAAQILLDRCVPTMQSIDQTTHTDSPELTPQQVEEMLADAVKDMARRNPDELQAIVASVTPLKAVS